MEEEKVTKNETVNESAEKETKGANATDKIASFGKKLMDTDASKEKYTEKEINDGKGMGVLSYILPFIPFFVEKNNKFVKYHAKQGMNLLILAIGYGIISGILTSVIKVKGDCGYGYWGDVAEAFGATCKVTPWWITVPLTLISVCFTVLCVIGIINVCKGKAKELPVVGKFKIFK